MTHPLFDPNSEYSKMRWSLRSRNKLRGYWLRLAFEREEARAAKSGLPSGAKLAALAYDRPKLTAARRKLIVGTDGEPLEIAMDPRVEGDSLKITLEAKNDELLPEEKAFRFILFDPRLVAYLRSIANERQLKERDDEFLLGILQEDVLRDNVKIARGVASAPDIDGKVELPLSQVIVAPLPSNAVPLPENVIQVVIFDTEAK